MRDRNSIYRDILNIARARVADASRRSDRERHGREVEHLGLIPSLLNCADERRHRHYLEVDRPRFERVSRRTDLQMFEPLWAELWQHLPHADVTPQPVIAFARVVGPIPLGYGSPRGTKE